MRRLPEFLVEMKRQMAEQKRLEAIANAEEEERLQKLAEANLECSWQNLLLFLTEVHPALPTVVERSSCFSLHTVQLALSFDFAGHDRILCHLYSTPGVIDRPWTFNGTFPWSVPRVSETFKTLAEALLAAENPETEESEAC